MMRNIPLSLGLVSVEKDFNTDMAGTFRRVRELGYDGVEIFRNPVYDVLEMRQALKDTGLQLFGWHTDWERLGPDYLDSTIAYHKYIGNPYIIICALGGIYEIGHTPAEDGPEKWDAYAQQMNRIQEKMRRHGLRLGYHTHEHEYAIHYDGVSLLDYFYDQLDPEIGLQIDTGGALMGHADPAAYIRKYARRSPSIHVKPYSHALGLNVLPGDPEDASDWPDILCAADASDAGWLVVEYYARPEDPFTAAGQCRERLADMMKKV